LLPIYLQIRGPGIHIRQRSSFMFIMTGMIASGLLLSDLNLLVYYFSLYSIFFLFNSEPQPFVGPNDNIDRQPTSKWEAMNAFLHNFHYYLFAFTMPLIALIYTNNLSSTGLFFSLGWVLFLFKDRIID